TRDVHVRCPRQALMHYPHHLPISFSQAVRPHHDPPSFPTRRSSDLIRFIRAASTTFTTEQAYSTLPGFGDKIPYYGTNIALGWTDRKSTRLNSSHGSISYAVFCLKKKIQSHSVTHILTDEYGNIVCT